MSYRIDGETPYWGGKTLSDPIKPASEETVEACIKAFESFSKEVKKETDLLSRMEGTSRDIKKALETIEKLEQIAMEEKKTKKMTKAEAFEWLKCKKIDACGYLEEVQEKLFSVGIAWITGDTFVAHHGTYLFIDEGGKLTHGGCDEAYWKRHRYEEIKAEDILSLEIVGEKKEETENINIELEKWIGVIRDKFCCNGWSFVISASNFALISGDLIEEKMKKD